VPLSQDWQEKVEVEKRTRTDQYVGLFFNLKHPLLGDKSARQALAYAAKKDFGGLKRAVSPISPDSWAFNPDVKTYDFDADRAKELFDSLFTQGAEATESAVPLPNQADVNLTISATPSLLPIAEAIKSNWEEVLGIRVQVTATNTVSSDFEVLLIGQEIFPDPDQYPLWHSTQPQNLTHYQSPKVDKLLEDARQILDQAKRKERYLDFQRFLVEDSPVVFLYHPETFTISRRSAAAK
jgi:peptide/nickel transport system substrate-binding protein